MLLVEEILGRGGDPRYAGRSVDRLLVTSSAATKRRLRARTEAGTDIALDLPRGSYLEHGAVLFDDGERIIVAVRKPEEALVIRLSSTLDRAEVVRQAASIGHAFGNQHVPLEVVEGEIRVPITTSRDIAAATVERLALEGAEVSFDLVEFAHTRPAAGTPAPHGRAHGEP